MAQSRGLYRSLNPDKYRDYRRFSGEVGKVVERRITDDSGQALLLEFMEGAETGRLWVYLDTVSHLPYTEGQLLHFDLGAGAREIRYTVGGVGPYYGLWMDGEAARLVEHTRTSGRAVEKAATAKRATAAQKKLQEKSAGIMKTAGSGTPEKDLIHPEDAKIIAELNSLGDASADFQVPDPYEDVWLAPAIGMPQARQELLPDPGYLRIGYISFHVGSVAESIQVREATPFEQKQTLRSRTPIQKGNTHAAQVVTITLTFDSPTTMNRTLLPLVRLFKRAPFLPVINTVLNDQGIDALALQGIQVQTVPQFPNVLQATLTCWSFNWRNYFPSAESFDDQLCYPLLKLWAESYRDPTRKGNRLPQFQHFQGNWTGRFQLKHGSERWLDEANEFPLAAQRASSWNRDVANIQKAADWRIHADPKFRGPNQDGYLQGWDVARAGTDASHSGEQRVFRGDAGRAIVSIPGQSNTDWIFLRLRDPIVAAQLATSSDDFLIFKGNPRIGLNTTEYHVAAGGPYMSSETHFGWSLAHGDTMSPQDFRRFIEGAAEWEYRNGQLVPVEGVANRPSDKQTVTSVQAGYYVFAIPAGSTALFYLNRLKPVVLPRTPEEFVGDNDNVFAPRSMVVETISASVENLLAPLQVRGERIPTHQYLGGMATVFQVAGTISNASDVAYCSSFLERVNALARKYPGRLSGTPFGGFVAVENELFQFLGVRRVLPLQWEVTTVEDFPNVLRFQLTLVEFDETQRSKELLQALTEDLRAADKRDGVKHEITSVFDNMSTRYLRQRELKRRLRSAELYPDLCLPTHATLAKWIKDIAFDQVWDWDRNAPFVHRGDPTRDYSYLAPENGGTGWQWLAHKREIPPQPYHVAVLSPQQVNALNAPPEHLDRFADPDFYCAPSNNWGKAVVDAMVEDCMKEPFEFYDQNGDSVERLTARETMPQAIKNGRLKSKNGAYAEARKVAAQNRQGPDQAYIKPKGSAPSEFDKQLHRVGSEVPVEYLPFGEKLSFSPNGLVQKSPAAGNPDQFVRSLPRDPGGTLEERRDVYKDAVVRTALSMGVDPALLMAILHVESGFRPGARSGAGAIGLGQFLPGTFREVTRRRWGRTDMDPMDPGTSIIATAEYLRFLLQHFNGDASLAIAAYNAGPGNVDRHGVSAAPAYVTAVRSWWLRYQKILGPSGAQLELSRAELQLKALFQRGMGYPDSVLDPWIDRSLADDPEKRQAKTNPRAFIDPDWLTAFATNERLRPINPFGGEAGLTPAITSEPETLYYAVKARYLDAFVRAAKKAGFTALPTAPITDPLGQDSTASTLQPHNYRKETSADMEAPPTTPQEAFFHPEGDADMFHDMRREMIVGRLLGAFPSFYVAIIDGGRPLRIWRLFDHIYGLMAVTSIQVHRTRKGPIETAVVGFSNMYGHLTAQAYETARIQEDDPRGIFNAEWLSRTFQSFFKITEETINAWSQHVQSMMLKSGSRLHIRMGYGSDANHLPVVFNGTITEVPISEGEVQVVALSDGFELTNEVPPNAAIGSIPVVRFNSYMGAGLNPRDLILLMLDPNSDWWKKKVESATIAAGKLSPVFLPEWRNAYGIEHFGYPTVGFLDHRNGELGINLYNPAHFAPVNETPAHETVLQSLLLWDWKGESVLMGVQMQNARPWDIIEACRKTVPDYMAYAVPSDFRSTLFYGKPWFPLYQHYRETIDDLPESGDANAAPERYFQRKTFQQIHLIHSSWNLMATEVRADATNVVTNVQAVGTYNGWMPGTRDMGVESSWLMQLDSDIYTEHQRTKVVESGLYTTVEMKLQDALDLGHALLALGGILGGAALIVIGGTTAPTGVGAGVAIVGVGLAVAGAQYFAGAIARLLQSRRILDYYAAMTLKDHVKDMYQGPLVIQGTGWIKPFDLCQVQDLLSGLNGPCEVKEVIQTMSVETGFITEIIPDACVTFTDYDGQEIYNWASMTGLQALTHMSTLALLGQIGRQTSNRMAINGVRRMRDWLVEELKNAQGSTAIQAIGEGEARKLLTQMSDDMVKIAGGGKWYDPRSLGSNLEYLANSVRNGGSGNYARINALLRNLTSEEGAYHALYQHAPFHIRGEISVVRGLREMVGLTGENTQRMLATAGEYAKAGLDGVVSQASKLRLRYQSEIAEATRTLEALERQQFGGRSVSQLAKLPKAELEKLDDAAQKAVTEFKGAKGTLRRASIALQGAEGAIDTSGWLARMGPEAVRWLSTAAGKLVTKSIVMGVVMGLCDGIAQLVERWCVSRQCLVIWPLRVWDKEYTAGIYGHRGAVIGDTMSEFDQVITGVFHFARTTWWAGFIPILGNLAEAEITYEHNAIQHKLFGDLHRLESPDDVTAR